MFADSFSVFSIHRVARVLGASFLYKCRASRGDSLRQHGLLVLVVQLKRHNFGRWELFRGLVDIQGCTLCT